MNYAHAKKIDKDVPCIPVGMPAPWLQPFALPESAFRVDGDEFETVYRWSLHAAQWADGDPGRAWAGFFWRLYPETGKLGVERIQTRTTKAEGGAVDFFGENIRIG